MTICLKTQIKEIEEGTLRIQKVLEKDSKVPYYIGTYKAKNWATSMVITKRFSKVSFSELTKILVNRGYIYQAY